MENNKAQTPQTLTEGMIVYVQGYEFEVHGPISSAVAPDGRTTWYFTGVCTDSKRNDSIRKTGFNTGRYSWRPRNV